MVNEKNGWLISPGNFPELKNAMEEGILLDEKKLRSKKNEAVTIVENNFLWDQIAAKTAAVLAEKIK
jgi:glycosyltransferase involved in cell wall biosynthesis